MLNPIRKERPTLEKEEDVRLAPKTKAKTTRVQHRERQRKDAKKEKNQTRQTVRLWPLQQQRQRWPKHLFRQQQRQRWPNHLFRQPETTNQYRRQVRLYSAAASPTKGSNHIKAGRAAVQSDAAQPWVLPSIGRALTVSEMLSLPEFKRPRSEKATST